MGTEIWGLRNFPEITIRCDDASLYTARIAPFPDIGREATGYTIGQYLPEDRWAHLIVMRFLTSRPPNFMAVFSYLDCGPESRSIMGGGINRHPTHSFKSITRGEVYAKGFCYSAML